MPTDQSTAAAPPSNEPVFKTVNAAGEVVDDVRQEQRPEDKSVSFAPASTADYQIPPLTDPIMAGQLSQSAFDVGLSVPEVSIIAEQLAQVSPESLTEENCTRELVRLWGSAELQRRMDTIAEAFGPQLKQHQELLDRTGLGNSPAVIQMLYNSASRKLGRYHR